MARRSWQSMRMLLLVSCLLVPGTLRSADPMDQGFPRFEGLKGNVEFWTSVFAEWKLSQAAVHDLEYPGLVYEVVDLPGEIEARYTGEQKDFLESVRDSWEYFLYSLENKVRDSKPLADIERQWLGHITEIAGADALKDAHERVRTQRGLRERFREGLARSHRWDPEMRRILREAGLPEDLAYLPHVESSFQTDARSSAGASGLWQFTRGTGKIYMTINSAIDERLDPIAATHGAAGYLKDAFEKLETWPLALTSYNHGVRGMQRAKERFGSDFAKIYSEYKSRTFGFASKNFYCEFLAAADIASRPDEFFPEGYDPEPVSDLDRFELPRSAGVTSIARRFDLPPQDLAAINPAWTRRAVGQGAPIPAGTRIWLPRGTLPRTASGDIAEPVLEIEPEPVAGPAASVTVAGWIDDDGRYVVQEGDTLSLIAATHGVSLSTLKTLNRIPRRNHIIRVGQRLHVDPRTAQSVHLVDRGETLSEIAQTYGVSVPALRVANDMTAQSSVIHVGQKLRLPRAASREHVVRPGETLLRIAASYGVRLVDLLSANTLTMQSIIHPGQRLRIPR